MIIEEFKKKMQEDFGMAILGFIRFFLGIKVKQSEGELFINQKTYYDLIKRFNISNCNPASAPVIVNEKLTIYDGAKKVMP